MTTPATASTEDLLRLLDRHQSPDNLPDALTLLGIQTELDNRGSLPRVSGANAHYRRADAKAFLRKDRGFHGPNDFVAGIDC